MFHILNYTMYTLKSEIDNQSFGVNQKVVEASTLLKNICDLTNVSEAIVVNCSGKSIEYYIDIINNYDLYNEILKSFEENDILKKFNDNKIYEIVKEMSIWDSDAYFDFIADLILYRIQEDEDEDVEETCMERIHKFFDFVDDFSVTEKKYIESHKSEFLFSINTVEMKFPFPNTNFQSLQSKVYTPMNVLLARIIKRSGPYEAFQFSMINKALKNENDRHPIKVSDLCGAYQWNLDIFEEFEGRIMSHSLQYTTDYDSKYFDAIKNRKLQIAKQFFFEFGSKFWSTDDDSKYSIFDYIIPKIGLEVNFHKDYREAIHAFDVTKFSYPMLVYKTEKINMKFKEFFQRFIETALSKIITIADFESFNFLNGGQTHIYIFKNKNAPKFHQINLYPGNETTVMQEFKDLVLNYMEDDGVIKVSRNMFEVSNTFDEKRKLFVYEVSSLKNYFKN